jgi:hypothetical protein
MATTEMATAVQNGVTGFVDTSLQRLIPAMRMLLSDPAEAKRLGDNARRYAQERFALERFVNEWNEALADVTGVGLRSRVERKRHVETHCAH